MFLLREAILTAPEQCQTNLQHTCLNGDEDECLNTQNIFARWLWWMNDKYSCVKCIYHINFAS